jgi:hypothetical protein
LNRARTWRYGFALCACLAGACAPILGLDDLEARPIAPDAGGDTGVDAPSDAGNCTTHAECVDRAVGSPARCVDNVCVNVETIELCNQQILPNKPELLKDEKTILVAAFLQGGNPLITAEGRAYQMALDEIEAAGGILPSGRHLAVLFCDADPAKVERGVKHVVNDLHVPAILAAFGTGNLAKLVAGDVANAGVFTMNPSFTTDYLRFADTGRLVWSLLGTYEDVALAYRPILEQLKEEKQLAPDIKVALIATNGSLDAPMADVVHKGPADEDGGRDKKKAIAMSGNLSPEEDPTHFKRFPIESFEFTTTPNNQAFQKVIDDVVEFEPDVIIALTDLELELLFPQIDSALYAKYHPGPDAGADAGPARKGPYWILGPSNGGLQKTSGPTALGVYIKEKDEHRARVIGVQFAGALETEQQVGFRERMVAKYEDPTTLGLNSENFYDAIYWLAYGFAAKGPGAKVAGESFSDGVRKLYKGSPPVHPGNETTVQDSFREIAKLPKEGTLYVGALGPPDINEPTGTWNSVGASYCYPPWQEQSEPRYDVRRYSSDGGLVPVTGTKPITCTSSN